MFVWGIRRGMESKSSKPCCLSHPPWQQADHAVPYVLAGTLLPVCTQTSMLCEVNAIKSYHFLKKDQNFFSQYVHTQPLKLQVT